MKFLRKNNDNLFGDFAGDDEYYRGGDLTEKDVAGNDADVAASGSLHNQKPAETPAAPVGSVTAALKIYSPKSYDDASEIADYLMNGNTVLLNIETLSRENAIRLLDYLSGATHVIGGIITKVGKTTIVVAPKNMDVSSIEAMVGGNS